MQFRDLHRQYEAMKAEMDEAMLRVAASGAYIMGPQVAELEQQLAEYVGVKHCISCANGTDALRMALLAIGIKKGDAVFVPDFTFFATAEAVAEVGATPIFVDICGDTFNISSHDLLLKLHYIESETTLKPRAVIAVDLFGLPADYTDLVTTCHGHGLYLIEDGAQGFGGAIGSRKACSFGDISTTSFFPAKPLGCYGDGGAMFTNRDDWAETLRSLRVHGKGENKYDNIRLGFNSRLDTMQAAVLQVKLRHFDSELKAVQNAAAKYTDLIKAKNKRPVVLTPVTPHGFKSSWAQYTIITYDRQNTMQRFASAGVPCGVYYPRTMQQQPAFATIAKYQQPSQQAESLVSSVLSLPMHPYMTDEEIETVASLI